MSVQVERLEKNMAKLAIEVDTVQFKDTMERAFSKSKNKFNIPDFRKGKAPRAIIEKMYGEDIFCENTADEAVNATCIQVMNENELEIVSKPKVSTEQIGKDKPFIYATIVAIRLEVTLGEYEGIEVGRTEAAVTAKDVDAELKRIREQSARRITVEDRSVTDGNQTVVDFEGFAGGKSFNGGKTEDYALTIGSHSFVDIFEERLIDKNIEEEYEVNVTFPEEYHAAELTGKSAIFKVAVREIRVKELSELDDEFTSEVSELNTLGEYKKDIEAKVLERKQKEAITENENRVIEEVVANATMETPDRMVEGQIDNMVQDTVHRMQSQGLSMEMYMRYTGTTMEPAREQMQPQVLKGTQTRLVLEEVTKTKSIQVSDERLDKEIAEMAASYQMGAGRLEKYMLDHGKGQTKGDLTIQEAVDSLMAEAKLV